MCNKQHHTLIHEDVKVKQVENVTTNHFSQHEDSRNKTYLQIFNFCISNGQTSIPTAAVLDNGSDSTKGISLMNILSMSNKMKSELVNFSISSCSHPQPLQIKNPWVVQDLQLSTSLITISSVKRKYSHLRQIPFNSLQDKNIKMLISADHPNLHLYTEVKLETMNQSLYIEYYVGFCLEETKIHLLVQ